MKILTGVVLGLLVLSGAAYAVDRSESDAVPTGVTISGVRVGGVGRPAAIALVQAQLGQRLGHWVEVSAGSSTFHLSPARAGVKYDYAAAVDSAIASGRAPWIGQRVWREVTGRGAHSDIAAKVTVSRADIEGFARRVAAKVDRPAVEAHLRYGPDWVKPAKGEVGRVVRVHALAASVIAAFESPAAGERVRVAAPMETVEPKTTVKGLADRYPTVITVSRSGYRLYLFKRLKLAKTFPVAVGMAGLETPAGLYGVQEKQVNPSWHVPNSPWAGKLAGKVIPPGPDDPIKARWMGLAAGVGIHGTSDESSLGSAASHGCIRMAPVDVIWLYDRVPVGTPVYIF
ncbi:MAG: L,D-transpeptidase family protein [Actinobacteria bacterium]|nr:L,D-transpeptidase family protein [Actinomycetota bacterium]